MGWLIVIGLIMAEAVSCSRLEVPENQTPENPQTEKPVIVEAKSFYASTPAKETKTYLGPDGTLYWSEDDLISVFQSSTNEQYLFGGEAGDMWGVFNKNDESVPSTPFSHNFALYPWLAGTTSPAEGTLAFILPDTQTYAAGSIASGTNPMVAVTETATSDEFQFQNLCGFLQIRIYGGATVRRIRFHGNNNEVLCGNATVSATYGSVPTLALSGEGGKVLTIDCGEGGVLTGETAGAYTPFWLVVPPTVFSKGFTFEIERTSGDVSYQSTSNSITVERSHARPMSAFRVDPYPKEMLTFSLSDGVNSYEAFEIKNDIISVQVPNGTDMSDLVATFTHNGSSVSVGGTPQTSGVDSQDFSDFATPVQYVVTASDASTRTYSIRMFNLPVIYVDTPNKQAITSKEIWIPGSTMTIRDTDGTVTVLGTQVKGRGNWTWEQAKKPYAIKLDKKASILGMSTHKRWCLLSNCLSYFFGNLMGYEMGRRTESLGWNPHGRYVELILNGTHVGCYLLTEQIKIDKNRLNITEIGSGDIAGEALTGGYLLTYDNTWDELYKFKSAYHNLPVMFKIPDEDIPDVQFNYVQEYINNFEASLKDDDRLAKHEYRDYIDVDSFIDQYLVWEIAGIPESQSWSDFVVPRSVYFHKDRGGKLRAGPVWDFDIYFFRKKEMECNDCQYYGDLFRDPAFVQRVKEKWPILHERLNGVFEGKDPRKSMVQYLDSLHTVVRDAAIRDREIWPWAGYAKRVTVDEQWTQIREGLPSKLDWLDAQFAAMSVTFDNKGTGTQDFGDQTDGTGDFGFGF